MLKYISLSELSPQQIKCEFAINEMNIQGKIDIQFCVLKVTGEYPDGSKGAHIGEYLRGLSLFLREYYDLDALIINLSELNYKWGNNLLGLVNPILLSDVKEKDWLGYYVIASRNNKKALVSLFCDFGKALKKIYLSIEDVTKDIKKVAESTFSDISSYDMSKIKKQ